MNNLTNPPRNAIGDRAGPEWQRFPTDAYLDHRHRNWVISEELDDVLFLLDAGIVLVHRVRAAHIVRALAAVSLAPAPRPCGNPHVPVADTATTSRWREICGWLGITAGAAVFVAALAVPLDDPALVVALAVRGGQTIFDGSAGAPRRRQRSTHAWSTRAQFGCRQALQVVRTRYVSGWLDC